MDRLAVRHDHVLERQIEHGAERREHALLVPGGAPNAQRSPTLRHGVGEDERALLGEPQRRFVPAAPVVERDEAAGQLASGLDRLELGFGDVVAPEEARAERPGVVALDDAVDVANVVGLQHDGNRGGTGVEPVPHGVGGCIGPRDEPVEDRHLPTRFDTRRGDGRIPVDVRRPVGMLGPPDPEAGGDVADHGGHGAHRDRWGRYDGRAVKLEPLYHVEFVYPEGWSIELAGDHGSEWQDFYLAEGTCTGRVPGRMRGANHPRRRTDGTYCPDFQGVIVTADGAEVMFDWRGYGRAYPVGARQIVLTATHLAQDERYRWLNDVVCVGVGEVRTPAEGDGADLVIDVAELVWEPPGDGS